MKGLASASAIRSAIRVAPRSFPTSSASTANSSPPKRATVSPGRSACSILRATDGEELVAGGVAEAVVDDLELVEVQEEHRDRGLAPGGDR